jgi:HEAT repeat protein
MLKSKLHAGLLVALVLALAGQSFGQTVAPSTPEEVNKLIGVLKSDGPLKEKVDACRQLSVIGTKEAVAPLAALLGDEKLSHMARYALEPIPDPSVDEALRAALGTLKGSQLVGVIGSLGVRQDRRAVRPLTEMLGSSDADVAQAAARALGSIGSRRAAGALQQALPNVPAGNQLAFCEGLLRCAERFAAGDRKAQAIEIYDQLRGMKAAHQVRGGALRGAILARGEEGLPLLREHLKSDDYILFSAAVQASLEMPGGDVTAALASGLKGLSAEILILRALGERGDAAAMPAVLARAKEGEKAVRVEAIRALGRIGDASAVPVLKVLSGDSDAEISKAAKSSMAFFEDPKAGAK